jgi:hypothetical protein
MRQLLRLFVATPSDLNQERAMVDLVAQRVTRELGRELGFVLEVVRWETHVPPSLGRPQQVVLDAVDFSEIDIFVGALWLRFGTETGASDPASGQPFGSGTEEEFFEAHESWAASGRPRVLFYRRTTSPPTMDRFDTGAFGQVSAFFTKFEAAGANPGLFRAYRDPHEFEVVLQQDLSRIVRDLMGTGSRSESLLRTPDDPLLYLPADNDLRNGDKRDEIQRSRQLNLLAQTGHSFLARFAHRFRADVEQFLRSGGEFNALLLNPWSIPGWLLALAEVPATDIEGSLTDPAAAVATIESAAWYSKKLQISLDGYHAMVDQADGRLKVRFTAVEMPHSILVGDQHCFVEPYLCIHASERMTQGMMTFETRFTADSAQYNHCSTYFDARWREAMGVDEMLTREPELKSRFRDQFNSMVESGALAVRPPHT